MSEQTMSKSGILISRDVFFSSKVTGTAAALGLTVRTIASCEPLRDAVGREELGLVILDLECAGVTPSDVIAALGENSKVSTVAFGPHVHETHLAEAQAAGFD